MLGCRCREILWPGAGLLLRSLQGLCALKQDVMNCFFESFVGVERINNFAACFENI